MLILMVKFTKLDHKLAKISRLGSKIDLTRLKSTWKKFDLTRLDSTDFEHYVKSILENLD